MPGGGLVLTANCDQRSAERELNDDIERHAAAVDDREPGRNAVGLDRLAIIAGEHGAILIVKREAAAADCEMASLGRKRGSYIGRIVGGTGWLQHDGILRDGRGRSPDRKSRHGESHPLGRRDG